MKRLTRASFALAFTLGLFATAAFAQSDVLAQLDRISASQDALASGNHLYVGTGDIRPVKTQVVVREVIRDRTPWYDNRSYGYNNYYPSYGYNGYSTGGGLIAQYNDRNSFLWRGFGGQQNGGWGSWNNNQHSWNNRDYCPPPRRWRGRRR